MSQPDHCHPEWLNQSFFERVIKHYVKDNTAEVKKFVIQSGSQLGENFASSILRASINYIHESVAKSISVIVKTMPAEDGGDVDAKRLFMTEMKMYGETLTRINRLLLNTYDDIKLFPR